MSSLDRTPVFGAEITAAAHPQCAALCWRLNGGAVQILLITSRDTGRWIVPKGWLLPALSPGDGACVEAWEEAGVRGSCTPEPLGTFTYAKRMEDEGDRLCLVAVFGVRVTRLERRYPERRLRRRKWFTPEKAARRVTEPELQALILGFRPGAACADVPVAVPVGD